MLRSARILMYRRSCVCFLFGVGIVTGGACGTGSATVGCASYTACAGGAEVILCTREGGGHEPGNASVGWPVLKRHALP